MVVHLFLNNNKALDFLPINSIKNGGITHQNILDELSRKKLEDNQQYYRLYLEIECIFNCCPTTNQRFTFTTGLPTEILLECIKWLFLEQDVTYWNYSGRQMFFNSIKEI